MVLVGAAGHLPYPLPGGWSHPRKGEALQGLFRAPGVTFPGPCVSWHVQAAVACLCQDSTSPTLRLASTTLRWGGEGGACVSTLSPERGCDPPRFTESGLGSGSHRTPSSAGQGRERRRKSEQVGTLGAFSPNLRKRGPPPEGRMKSREGSGEPQASSHVCVPCALSPSGDEGGEKG